MWNYVCLFLCTITDFSVAAKARAWNLACVFDYYPDRSSPLWWTLAHGESRGRRHMYGPKVAQRVLVARHLRRGSVGIGNWRRRVRPYGGICVLEACRRTCWYVWRQELLSKINCQKYVLLWITVKELLTSVNIWQSYVQENSGIFLNHSSQRLVLCTIFSV